MKSLTHSFSKITKLVTVAALILTVFFTNTLPAQAATLENILNSLKALQTNLQTYKNLPSGKVLGVSTGAYDYVKPSDVGVNIGVGSVAPAPTVKYTGRYDVRLSGVIENVIIDGCLEIFASNVTLRNVKINCGTHYGVKLVGGVSNFVMENSFINCTSQGKVFYFETGGPNAKIRYNESTGCEDFFFLNGNLEGVEISYNYMHNPIITPESHADGFQIGEGSRAYGAMLVKGNNFQVNKTDPSGQTGLLFTTNYSEVDITLENNFIPLWGIIVLRCGGTNPKCTIKNNVFPNVFKTRGYISQIYSGATHANSFVCNRYEDGSILQEVLAGIDLVQGTHVTTNCPVMGQIITPTPTPVPTPTPTPVTPTLTLSLAPTSVANGGASTLTWSSTNATACTASGVWSGTKSTSGSQSTGSLTATGNQTYTLTCTGSGGSISKSSIVTVAAPVVSAPTPIADTIDPIVTFTSPANDSTVLVGTSVPITVTATDASPIGGANFYINSVLTCSDTTAPYTCPLSVSTQTGVQYTLTTKVWDSSNNVGEATVRVTSASASTPTPTPSPAPVTAPAPNVITTDNLRVRLTPAGSILGTQKKGSTGVSDSTKQATLKGTNWIYVDFTTGPDGYVSSAYLSGTGSMSKQELINSLLAQMAVLQAALAALLLQ